MGFVDSSLLAHHKDLEGSFVRLMADVEGEDVLEGRAAFLLFARELNEHFAAEEQHLIPGFRRVAPDEASRLCEDHREIRNRLASLAIAIDLRTLRTEAVANFLALLRAHAQREEELLYPWAQQSLSHRRLEAVGQWLGKLSRKVTESLRRPGATGN
ncbi:MAG TPA: hemerythrin domain-containing protein [Polyangia bacterium]